MSILRQEGRLRSRKAESFLREGRRDCMEK